jgi:hypothetical protein
LVDVGTACENGLHRIGNQERYRALRCLEHLDHFEAWRATLDEVTKRSSTTSARSGLTGNGAGKRPSDPRQQSAITW